jgi:hypothetical protein
MKKTEGRKSRETVPLKGRISIVTRYTVTTYSTVLLTAPFVENLL